MFHTVHVHRQTSHHYIYTMEDAVSYRVHSLYAHFLFMFI